MLLFIDYSKKVFIKAQKSEDTAKLSIQISKFEKISSKGLNCLLQLLIM